MGDEFQPLSVPMNEIREGSQWMKHRQIGFQRLFHGRDDNFLEPVVLDDLAFGMLAEQGGNFIYTDFCGFFKKPFQPFDILGGSDGHVQVKIPFPVLFRFLYDTDGALPGIGGEYLPLEPAASSIHEIDRVPRVEA